MHILKHPELKNKSILLIDKAPKTTNDRTWCFWQNQQSIFEDIIQHRWGTLNFYSDSLERKMNIYPYAYKMIRGIDFYQFCFSHIQELKRVDIHYAEVTSIGNDSNKPFVELSGTRVYADYLFNSILFKEPTPVKGKFLLLQHFKGWVITTRQPMFDSSVATLMDFRTNQKWGPSFFYVMPTSATEALVEYTVFSPQTLPGHEYITALKQYISTRLNIQEYEVSHEEYGVIPMTNIPFETNHNNIIHIGTAGGQVKPSSGYAFKFIQKQSEYIVDSLIKGKSPSGNLQKSKFKYYDAVFLNVLHHYPCKGADIFSKIFSSNNAETIFRFLDSESNFYEDLKIIKPLTSLHFIKAGIQEALKKR